MSKNILDRIVKWNQDRNLIKPINVDIECSFIIEEVLEILGIKYNQKQISLDIIEYIKNTYKDQIQTNSNSDLIDGFGDVIVFATGAIAKLNMDPNFVLNKIMDHNDKKGTKTDKNGKIIKDQDFINPKF